MHVVYNNYKDICPLYNIYRTVQATATNDIDDISIFCFVRVSCPVCGENL